MQWLTPSSKSCQGLFQEEWDFRWYLCLPIVSKLWGASTTHTIFFKRTNIYWPPQASSWRRQWHPTPVLLPGKSHGWRSLVGCNPRVHQESDTTELLHFHFSLSCIGEGNGNPLQCSCLENPRDGGAWWAAVYGIAQSRTWLKWLSNSSKLAL